jgi:hypothetical protein
VRSNIARSRAAMLTASLWGRKGYALEALLYAIHNTESSSQLVDWSTSICIPFIMAMSNIQKGTEGLIV